MSTPTDSTEILCTDDQTTLTFANRWLALTFDRATGRWQRLDYRPTQTPILDHGDKLAPVVFTVNGVTTATRGRAQWDSLAETETLGTRTHCTDYAWQEESGDAASDDAATLTLVTEEGDWQIEQRYTLFADRARLARSIQLTYPGTEPALLRDITLRLPPTVLADADNCLVEAPGYPTKPHVPLGALPLGEDWDRTIGKPFGVGWEPGVLGVVGPAHALAAWCHDETQPVMLRVVRVDEGAQVRHTVMLADRFHTGDSLTWSEQLIDVQASAEMAEHDAPSSDQEDLWQTTLAQIHAWYDTVNLRAPDEPTWVKSARIYEVYVGEQPVGANSRRSRYATLDDLIDDLPRIQALGCNVVQLMPHMPFPSYSIHDYYDVDVHYGSAAGLKRLTETAHARGMRVLLDVIVHGVLDQEALAAMNGAIGHGWADDDRLYERHPYRKEHPEWFMQTEYGTPAATYTWAFDHANESWRTFMVDLFCHYVAEYDVDGFRVDALIWNLFPNWAEGLPYHASASIFGSRELSERMRDAVQAIKPEVALYTETSIPLFARAYDLIYNYDMQWIFSALAPPIAPRGFAYTFAKPTERITARQLAEWLTQRRLVLPAGVTTVHHLDSHDSHEWGQLLQYRAEAFGDEVARAFFALCCSLEGAVMLFTGAEHALSDETTTLNNEAEIEEKVESTEAFYRRWLGFKRDNPALDQGHADYMAVAVNSPHVLAPLRTTTNQSLIPVIHLHHQETDVTLGIPAAELHTQSAHYRIVDLVSKEAFPGPSGPTWTPSDLARGLSLTLRPYAAHLLSITPV